MTEKVEEVAEVEEVQEFEEVVEVVHTDHEKAVQMLDDIEKSNKNVTQTFADIKEREAELFQKEVAYELKEKGLEAFGDVINVSDSKELEAVTKKLTAIVNDIKLSVSYVPNDNAKQDAYTVHKENKDTKSMIGSKLANLFK